MHSRTHRIVGIMVCLLLAAFGTKVTAQEQDSCIHLNEITVTGLTGDTHLRQSPAPILLVGNEFLHTRQSTNVIDAIARQPGVAQMTTGSGISKPVIRGLGYNRVLVVSNGVRQEGQQWGDEHGVEADAQSVHSVEILRGPASLMYGSDAMAGVIILHDDPTLPQGEMRGNASAEYQTNNGLFAYSLDLEGNKAGFVYNWRWSGKMAHDYKNHYDGYVANSRFRENALSGMVGLNRNWGYSRLRLSWYQLRPGIVEGERDDETGELLRSDNGKHYGMELPFQRVSHYKAVADNSIRLGQGTLKAILAYQQNRRQEYEESKDECGLDFLLHTINYDVRYVLSSSGGWKTNVGIGGMWQKSLNEGDEYLIPAYNLFDFGVFATASKSVSEQFHISGGLRFDTRHLRSHTLEEDEELRFESFSRTLTGLTGSFGAVWNAADNWDVRVNLARGYRAPNLSELGSNGVHEGTLRYERGNKGLKSEFSWQADLGTEYISEPLSCELSLFANRIENFIFLNGTDDEEDGMRVYEYTSGDALLMGGEARIVVHPLHHMHFENSFSYVYSRLLHQSADARHLPMTPAPRWMASLHYDLDLRKLCRCLADTYAEVEMDCNLRQDNIYRAFETETPTAGYALFNVYVGTDVMRRGRKLLSLHLSATNIFDKAYQNHLSRLKYADTNVLTGRTGVWNMGRNFGVKVRIPIII